MLDRTAGKLNLQMTMIQVKLVDLHQELILDLLETLMENKLD